MAYLILADSFESELVVKKSRFIARVAPVANRDDVNRAVTRARADYPDARHHCWAYLLGKPAHALGAGMNDDGEPAGTAGKPILSALQHGEFGDVLAVVIRYFGGIKLGAGGLVRAYGGATRQALALAPHIEHRILEHFVIAGDFPAEQSLRHLLSELAGELIAVEYSNEVTLTVAVPGAASGVLVSFCHANGFRLRVLDKTALC